MKPKFTTPSGVTGTYPWLLRELAHHPARFNADDLEYLNMVQPYLDPRWRAILQIRELSNTPLPDQFVNNVIDSSGFMLGDTEYVFDGFFLRPTDQTLS